MYLISGGEQFCKLWANIPECQCQADYYSLLNYIEDCYEHREITPKDYTILTSCTEHFARMNNWET